MPHVLRLGSSHRWSDVVIHAGVARWVEVPADQTGDTRSQFAQVLDQIDATLREIRSDRQSLLEILIFLADLADQPLLNEIWDAWVPAGHAPIRACVAAGLGVGCRVEMIISAAVDQPG